MDKVEQFFYGVLTTIYISWDPNKDPTMAWKKGLRTLSSISEFGKDVPEQWEIDESGKKVSK